MGHFLLLAFSFPWTFLAAPSWSLATDLGYFYMFLCSPFHFCTDDEDNDNWYIEHVITCIYTHKPFTCIDSLSPHNTPLLWGRYCLFPFHILSQCNMATQRGNQSQSQGVILSANLCPTSPSADSQVSSLQPGPLPWALDSDMQLLPDIQITGRQAPCIWTIWTGAASSRQKSKSSLVSVFLHISWSDHQ